MANAPAVESPAAFVRASVSVDATPQHATPQHATQTQSLAQWIIGCAFLVIVAVIWNFSSVLVQYIFHDLSFEAPFFLTSFGMALFAVNLPIYYVTKVLIPKLRGATSTTSAELLKPHDNGEDESSVPAPLPAAHSPVLLRRTMIAAAIVSPLWFIANFTYNESLNLTSVTSSTILSATSSVFTLLFGVWILKEKFTWGKLLGVVLCMAGNISTLAKDSSGGVSDYFWGDVCAFAGAVMYGVYTTAIRLQIPDNSGISVSLFFGFVGLFSFCGLAVLVLVFNYTHVESLHGLTWEIIGLLFVQGLFNNVLADYLWAVAILYTSTTVATVGLSLTVPMAILSDWIIHGIAPTYVTIISSLLVLGGFVTITLSTRKEQLETKQEQQRALETPSLASPAASEYKQVDH